MTARNDVKKYARFLEAMPVIPAVAAEVLFMVEDASRANYAALESKLSLDPGLSIRLLKIANSAAYGRSGQVDRVATALSVIGFQTARSLILLVIGTRLFDRHSGSAFLKDYWAHTLLTAFFARDFARHCGLRDLADEVFVSSMVFHLGEVSFWLAEPEAYQAVLDAVNHTGTSLGDAERERWGFGHHELGAALLESWGFPQALVDVAREHGKDNLTTPNKRLVRIVSVASAVARQSLHGRSETSDRVMTWMQEFSLTPDQGLTWVASVATLVRQDPLFRVCEDLLEAGT